MRRVTALVLLAFILVLSMSACGTDTKTADKQQGSTKTGSTADTAQTEQAGAHNAWPKMVTIATGNTGGAAYYIGATLTEILNKAVDGESFTVESTDGGFSTNGPFVQNDPSCLSFITLSAMQDALEGNYADLPGIKLDKMRLIMAGNATKLQFVTLKETGITSLEDLKGMKVATPSPGSVARAATLQVFNALGYKESDFASLVAMTLSDMGDALKDGTIDIGVFNGGIPGAAISDLNSLRDIVMLEIPEYAQDKVMADNPTYRTYIVTSEDYSDLTENCVVLGLPMGLACNADLDDDLVYEITKVLNESTDELAAAHTEGAAWNTENTLAFYNDGSIPFHPGAARYYDEIQGK